MMYSLVIVLADLYINLAEVLLTQRATTFLSLQLNIAVVVVVCSALAPMTQLNLSKRPVNTTKPALLTLSNHFLYYPTSKNLNCG